MNQLHVERCLPDGFLAAALRADAQAGLTAVPKTLPPKWFYDERGSELFEKITLLPEYYPTRAERSILAAAAAAIAAATGARAPVELGSGSSEKTTLLLDALREAGSLRSYVPADVSESALIGAAHRVLASYPGLTVDAVVSDFEARLGLPVPGGPRLVAFLGSTIGNLLPAERAAFLARLRAGLRVGPRPRRARARRASPGRLPGQYHRQPAPCGAGRVPGPAARGPARRRRPAARHRPGQGPGGAAGCLRRRRRGNRRVQQERAGRAQRGAGRRLRPGRLRPHGRVGSAGRVDRDAEIGRAHV